MPRIQFKGKSIIATHHLTTPYRVLRADAKKSVLAKGANPSLDDNVILHGDNLHALKALLPTHAGRVNCIYIDPPYNTGNEGWCYNDNVNDPMFKDWLGKVVDDEDLTRHDKWLCMMYPRLALLHELLAEDGVIFVSIDDNEQHRLRLLMDEIFGEDNFVANVIWQKKFSPQNDAKWFSDNHDFILGYAKNKENWKPNLLERTEKSNRSYKNPDKDPRGVWSSSGLDVRTYTEAYDYPITTPSGRVVNPPKGRCWSCGKDRFDELVKDNRIWFGEDGNNVPRMKRFLSEVKQGITPLTVWLHEEVGHNQSATQDLKEIGISTFQSPKPVRLLKKILHIGCADNGIVLDSFAGSGTAAQAVLEFNKADGGSRKFVLVECEEYAHTITAERVRRVIKGVKNAKDESLKKGLGGTFSYWELGERVKYESILQSDKLPSYEALAEYVFFTATGEKLNKAKIRKGDFFIGESALYEVYLIYASNAKFLKENPLTLDVVSSMPKAGKKWRLVYAAARYATIDALGSNKIKYCQLPFEIYRIANKKAGGKKR